ncbi:MAG TPA: alpha-ketoglutarate-dependent dioxygenase AlkB [Kofleriaceae bacterium]|nr:alpha-ketoglutarate-dependent dioxygenase AlkB [Kofleriaceae bacterium]
MLHEVVRQWLTPRSWLDYQPAWLGAAEAAALMVRLRDQLVWEQRSIVLFGREVLQPRLIAWAGEQPYRYSGRTLEARPFTGDLAALRDRVAAQAGAPFDHVLVNRYRDGNDSMGMHADDEPELGPDPVVAALSLGAPRRLVIQPRRKRDGQRRVLQLEPGSLLVMGGAFQHELRHGLPRAAGAGERISLTYRHIL